ncbi:phosphoglycerate kinase [Knoellia sinensis KCTC 19936]|uniref:Phosphoglycerate kinase n=1 Tax=Knoellia sinensis KCTC 19936 TaxID=1385520 RepID=A0A0A0J3M2_9MICO|nr:histidine phosphatase family protein [Knoellia sinensis]KGN31940.1 phosphoglycerate kinase [Knoellia sinensis KCTC 19936]
MKPVHLHLVRHGQSTWNVEGRLQGQTAHPDLTDLGHEQAKAAAAALTSLVRGSVAVVTSDLVRARHTAEHIAATLGVVPTPDPDLREQALGSLEGRLTSELSAEPTPDATHVSEVRWGGGESLEDVHRRLAAPIERARLTAYEHVVWVTHGDTMRVALARLDGRTHREVDWAPIGNGAVVSVTVARG